MLIGPPPSRPVSSVPAGDRVESNVCASSRNVDGVVSAAPGRTRGRDRRLTAVRKLSSLGGQAPFSCLEAGSCPASAAVSAGTPTLPEPSLSGFGACRGNGFAHFSTPTSRGRSSSVWTRDSSSR